MQGVSIELMAATVKKLEEMYGPRFCAPGQAMQAFMNALQQAEAAFQLLLPVPSEAALDRLTERLESDEIVE